MRKVLLIVFLVVMSVLKGHALDIIFRYDDFRLIDSDVQNQMIEVFAEEQVPLHIAIIPYNQDTTPILQEGQFLIRIKDLQQQGILQIALHGFCHKGETFHGEFLLLDEYEQRFRLERGSSFLDSVFSEHIHIFIPPWNRYDQTTLDILADLGFYMISSELKEEQLVSDNRFQYYNETIDHPAKLRKIITQNAYREGLVVCMFHEYDFSETFTMNDMRMLLQEIKANPQMHIVTMDELYQCDRSFNKTRISINLQHPFLTKVLNTRSIILPIADANRLRIYDLLLHLLVVIAIALCGAWLLRHVAWWYWVLQAMVFSFAGIQTWCQLVMPKVGLPLIIVLSLIVIGGFKFKSIKHTSYE